MEKRKIDMSKYADMHDEVTIKGKNDIEVKVRTHIPYEEKDAMAHELVENLAMIHDDSCIYLSPACDRFRIFMIVKYYTDVDVEGEDINNVVDFVINNELYDQIRDAISKDLDHVFDIYYSLYEALDTTYADDKSLTKAVRTSFGFLFNGEDITESLAKAEAMKDTVYEAIGALRKVEKEKEEKLDHGTLTIGGNVINFAKKE